MPNIANLIVWLLAMPLLALQPGDLAPQKNCEIWSGTVSGNDPSVQVQLRLCANGNDALSGVLQWASERSGWSQRAIAGAYDNATKVEMTLHDEKFLEYRPNPLWKFCLIDQYKLRRDGDDLLGAYFSKSCNDRAYVTLHRKQ